MKRTRGPQSQLRRWRKRNGYSQQDLGFALGVTRAAVSAWESGQRRPSWAHADAIKVITGIPWSSWFVVKVRPWP